MFSTVQKSRESAFYIYFQDNGEIGSGFVLEHININTVKTVIFGLSKFFNNSFFRQALLSFL